MTEPAGDTPKGDKTWYDYLTIDLIAGVLNRSIFHPFIAWLLPLCVRAVGADYDHPHFIATCIYASVITLLAGLSVVNKRVAYGLPRELNWDEEVVVITGGASGLGKIIAEMYGMRGASVAILDVQSPEKESEGLSGVHFYCCDVGDADAVEKVKDQIEKDLGTPTILINNAGLVNGKPMLSLSASDVQRNFNVNVLSHFYTIRAFLPGMLASETGGTIITVSSVLGRLGASHLSDYTAAKAGLIAMHASLRAELASPSAPEGAANVRTILVTPGQLSTSLFAGVQTPSSFLGPLVEPVELAREIVRMIDAGESEEISMPLYAWWVDWLGVLPAGLQKVVRSIAGVDRAMEGFRDRVDEPTKKPPNEPANEPTIGKKPPPNLSNEETGLLASAVERLNESQAKGELQLRLPPDEMEVLLKAYPGLVGDSKPEATVREKDQALVESALKHMKEAQARGEASLILPPQELEALKRTETLLGAVGSRQ